MHYPGYSASRQKVLEMDRQELVELIESLYGWSWWEDGIHDDDEQDIASLERLREEALRQHDWEWRVPSQHESHYPDGEA